MGERTQPTWAQFALQEYSCTSLRAKRSNPARQRNWIASSLTLLAMTRCLTIESGNLGERNRKAVIDGLPLPVPHQRPAHQCAVGPLAPAHRRVEPQPGETFDVGGAGTPR